MQVDRLDKNKQTKKQFYHHRPRTVLYTLCNRTNRTYPEGGDLERRPQAQAPLAPIRRPKAGGECLYIIYDKNGSIIIFIRSPVCKIKTD